MAAPMSLLPKPAAAPFTSFRPSVSPPSPHRRPSCSPPLSVSCGPRDNRGPLVRGRTLSTEAILAVQALKRAAVTAGDVAAAATRVDEVVSRTLARLIKSDLLAALAELQRQGHCRLALKVFVAMRGEIWYRADYAQYAQMVAALARNGMDLEIDDLVVDLLEEVQREEIDGNIDMRGLARLLKALIAAGKGKAVKDVYKGVKRRGIAGDEYLFKFLGKGLRRLGEGEAADEVERDYAVWCENGGRLGASAVRRERKKGRKETVLPLYVWFAVPPGVPGVAETLAWSAHCRSLPAPSATAAALFDSSVISGRSSALLPRPRRPPQPCHPVAPRRPSSAGGFVDLSRDRESSARPSG